MAHPEGPGSLPSIHMMAHKSSATPVARDSKPSSASVGTRHLHDSMDAGKIYT